MTTLTRQDCERDNVAVICPNATLLGFGRHKAKRGMWCEYENESGIYVGRIIGRVTCEQKIYIELAQATLAFSSAHIRWIEPEHVRELRANPPRNVFDFFASGDWRPEAVFAALEYGVSDMRDQLGARDSVSGRARRRILSNSNMRLGCSR